MNSRGRRREACASFRVEAGDALQAFDLARRLERFAPELVADGRRFALCVRLGGGRPSPIPELLAVIRRWMTDEAVDSTCVEIDGRPHILRPDA